MTQLTKYIKATAAEMRQVAWPSRQQAISYTLLVIAISTIVALYVGGLDYVFSQGVNAIVNRF